MSIVSSENPSPSRGALFVDVLKATKLPLLAGLVGFGSLIALWYYGLPWRSITLIVLVLSIGGPFIVTYSLLFVHLIRKRASIPVLTADDEHKTIGLYYFKPSEFAEIEIEGDELATRDSSVGKVYIAEDYRREQAEVVTDDGEKDTRLRRVLVGTWEAAMDSWEFVESRKRFQLWQREVVQIARAGVEARAGAGAKALRNTDQLAKALLVGAENDNSHLTEFSEAYEWDVDQEFDDITDLVDDAADVDDDREDAPEPGDLSLQEVDRNGDDAGGGDA